MPRYRPDIDGDLEMEIANNMNERGVSIERTAAGTRVKPERYPTPPEPPPPEVQLCSCCNERPKKPGNRFLCSYCEREG